MTYEGENLVQVIKILKDTREEVGIRDDIAMDFERVDDQRALAALIEVGENADDDEMVLNSCGESIGHIWVRKGAVDLDVYRKLSKLAQLGVRITIGYAKPEWLPQLEAASAD